MAASGPLAVPASPASSKRSRSRDSISTTATNPSSSTNTHHHLGVPPISSSQSAPSLTIPESSSRLPPPEVPHEDPTPYPAFLRLNIAHKFAELENEQRQRILEATHRPPQHHHQQQQHDQHPSPWARCTWNGAIIRNRYANVDPYRANRVCLRVPDGHNDYINASPIELTSTRSGTALRYIATQGPRPDTVSHFWRMVWDETTDPAVIVMLTQTHESGREKCYRYYPLSPAHSTLKLNKDDEYGDAFTHDLKLVSLSDHPSARAQVRELEMSPTPREPTAAALSNSPAESSTTSATSSPAPAPASDPEAQAQPEPAEPHKIWHLLFGGWPDFLVPEGADRAALLELIQTSRAKANHNLSNPRIVHCSAGVGRSGTFIALDWLLQELEEGSLDDLPDTADPVASVVATLRRQRTMMVQGDQQFAFIYDSLRDRWRERWISRFPDEAARLGVAPAVVVSAAELPPPPPPTMRAGGDDGPRLKRQKSARDEASLGVGGVGAVAAAGGLGNDVVDEEDEDTSDDDSGDNEEDDDEDDDEDGEDDEEDDEDLRIYHSQSGEARADLEAALQGAEMEFERGKT